MSSVTNDFIQYDFNKEIFISLKTTFSVREKEIMRKYVIGKTTKQIAQDLYLSPLTIQTHRSNMKRKTRCRTKAELIHYSMKMNLL
jgi:DNA-binding CsgD family transcriptional regulator